MTETMVKAIGNHSEFFFIALAPIESEDHIIPLIDLFDCVLLYLVGVISSVHIILRSSFSSGCCYIECSHIILLNGNEKFLDFSLLRTVKICNNLNLNHLKTILCKYLSHHLHHQRDQNYRNIKVVLQVKHNRSHQKHQLTVYFVYHASHRRQ